MPSPAPTSLFASLAGIGWPPVVGPKAAQVLAQLLYLEETQGWTPERLREHQLEQTARVARHAAETIPFWRERLAEAGVDPARPLTAEDWARIPCLSRAEVQREGAALRSPRVPREHGAVREHRTSGSTGEPVVVWGTGLTRFFWRCLTLRDHLWHERDFALDLATIRHTTRADAAPPNGRRFGAWGSATRDIVRTGACHMLDIQSSVAQQAAWLQRVDPGYLLSYPSTVAALVEHFRGRADRGRLAGLREVRTFGEIVEPALRASVRDVFGVPLVDTYSSQEVGSIALQCPGRPDHADHPDHPDHTGGEAYHVMAENVLVEVLDERDRPCGPGEVGRVVITTLQNFASPLLRYAIGDYARVGGPCGCGRGLPALERILGRQRNMLVLPGGQQRWPAFAANERPDELPPFHEFQLVQRSLEEIVVNVVRPSPFTEDELARVKAYFEKTLGHPFAITIHYVDAIPRSPTGRFDRFTSELTRA